MPSSPAPTATTNQFVTRYQFDRTTVPTLNSTTATATTMSKCQPQNYVVFLKTHKTGSSTITNILNRYADRNNLTMLLPSDEAFYSFNWPNKFRLSYAKDNHGKMPNILANHARYNRKSLNHLFPRERTSYITILREPVKQWESTFSYMSFPYILNIYKKKDPLDFFLKHPPSIENIKKIARRFPSIYLIKNPLFFDLGLDYKYYDNTTMIRRAVNTIDKDFNLVLMMEHFDESMVLLKRRLCWSIDDVVFFKTNERLNKNKRRVLTNEQEESIKKWNNGDIALYDYFVDKFWKDIEKEGVEFYDDLQELKERKRYYFRKCVSKETVTEAYSSVYVKGYEMRRNLTSNMKLFCERMLRNELLYQDYFKSKYAKKVKNLEGHTIENFDDQFEEAEVGVENGLPWGKEGEAYDYGLPTKSPKASLSKMAKSKRFRAENENKTTAKSKATTALKGKAESNQNKKRKNGKIILKKNADSEANQQQKVPTSPDDERKIAKGRVEPSTEETKTATPTLPITLEKYKSDKLMTLERHMIELERTTEEITLLKSTETPVMKTDPAVKKTKGDNPRRTKIDKANVTKPTQKQNTKKKKGAMTMPTMKTSTRLATKTFTRTTDNFIRYTTETKEVESANKELKKDDPRRYDGKTIITSKRRNKKK